MTETTTIPARDVRTGDTLAASGAVVTADAVPFGNSRLVAIQTDQGRVLLAQAARTTVTR